MPHSDKVHINVRIDRETWERFKLAAEADRRSAASMLRLVIERTAERFEQAEGQGGAP